MTAKQRLAIERQQMLERAPAERAKDFNEVNLGFTAELAKLEASRCLQCKNPKCMAGCPVGVDIKKFLELVEQGNFLAAAALMRQTNSLPALTGRVCPQEIQCEAECVRGIKGESVAIGHIERFIADCERAAGEPANVEIAEPMNKKVAIVGSGPAGLTAAADLARMGHDVTIFEAFHAPGGVLVYGIPEFRLPTKIVASEVENIKKLGVKIEFNTIIGRTYTIDELFENGFQAIFVANGAGLPVFLRIPGENYKGVYSANEYLTRVNLMGAHDFPNTDTPIIRGQQVAVIGGGNVAMDSVRTAKRLGAEKATIVYRRSEKEMPARVEEVHHARDEGIIFEMLSNPIRILSDEDGWVSGMECLRMELGEPDDSGRRRPVPVEGSNFTIATDVVVVAVGANANPLLSGATPDLKINKWGYIEADENLQTSKPGVFAGGDIVRGSATVILAMGDGRTAARSIDDYLKKL
jgi:glutamate synthase (NADPH/NADH) small chain